MNRAETLRPGNCTLRRVPTTPVRLIVPERCKLCGAAGTVSPETTIEHGIVRLTWCCRACNGEWEITRREQQLPERRRGERDRRRSTRTDRRGD